MSQFVATSELRAVVGGLWRQQVMDVVRGATFIGALLLAWFGYFLQAKPADEIKTFGYHRAGVLAAIARWGITAGNADAPTEPTGGGA